jgi:hypothetical protein
MIMLHPFVPGTMERLRESLRLPAGVVRIDELGVPIPAGYEIGPKGEYSGCLLGWNAASRAESTTSSVRTNGQASCAGASRSFVPSQLSRSIAR